MEEEDKCTVLYHPMDVTVVPEQKTYSHTKHCTGYSLSLYIFSSCHDDGFELIQNMQLNYSLFPFNKGAVIN